MKSRSLLLIILLLPGAAALGESFAAFRAAIGAGGGTSSGGGWQTTGTVGQGDAGGLAADARGGFAGAGGFWSALLSNSNPNRLGTPALLEGPAAGGDSVAILLSPLVQGWGASVSPDATPWLHLAPGNQAGTTSTNVIFTFDANPGPTRTGTLTVAGQTVVVTQSGASYVAAAPATLVSLGLNNPQGLAVDSAGNVYIADTDNNAVKRWSPVDGSVTTLAAAGLAGPSGVAVDNQGNVDIADTGNNALKQWSPVTASLSTLLSRGLLSPQGLTVDAVGDVYVADTYHNAIRVWQPLTATVLTLPLPGLLLPYGVAVDFAGNLYIADTGNSLITEWSSASQSVSPLPISGLSYPFGVAVDGGGNVYLADTYHNTISRWSPANQQLTSLLNMGLAYPAGVAVDPAGNVYATDTLDNRLVELPRAFVDPTPKFEPGTTVVDSLPGVLPSTANLGGPFTPTSDQSWLTITTVTNGVVSFSLATNLTGFSRLAHIQLLGQTIPITQAVITTHLTAPPVITGWQLLDNGHFQLSFTATPGTAFNVLSSTNLNLPSPTWTVIGSAIEITPGTFQFTAPDTARADQMFYQLQAR